jgi:poly-gamma-glutamate synthesis protein (capsule biosynthesis protein)
MRRIAVLLSLALVLPGLLVFFSIYKQNIKILISKKDLPSIQKMDYVNLREYIPSLEIDLVYYTENNFTGQKLYDSPEAYLRKGTADKLKSVAEEVGQKGYRLKIWDAYRPPQVQLKMWDFYPNPRFIANPYHGSDHSRGCAVDLTLTDDNGNELEMPSAFDDFSARADRDYSDVSAAKKTNAVYLENVMVRHGFLSIRTEWWHFADTDRKSYSITEEPVLTQPNTSVLKIFFTNIVENTLCA